MTYLYVILSLLALGILSYFKARQARQDGRDEEKLTQSQEALKNVEKSKGAWDRLSDDERGELRRKYGRGE